MRLPAWRGRCWVWCWWCMQQVQRTVGTTRGYAGDVCPVALTVACHPHAPGLVVVESILFEQQAPQDDRRAGSGARNFVNTHTRTPLPVHSTKNLSHRRDGGRVPGCVCGCYNHGRYRGRCMVRQPFVVRVWLCGALDPVHLLHRLLQRRYTHRGYSFTLLCLHTSKLALLLPHGKLDV